MRHSGSSAPQGASRHPGVLGGLILLADIPLELSLVAHTDSYAHAKAYHLSGPEGDVLLVGSANCSPAAWLRPPAANGNVEMMLVYEDPGPEDLAFIDELLEEEARPYAESFSRRPRSSKGKIAPSQDDEAMSLTAFQIEHDRSILARLAGGPTPDTSYSGRHRRGADPADGRGRRLGRASRRTLCLL